MPTEILSALLQIGVAIGGFIGAMAIFLLGRWWEKRDKSQSHVIETGVTTTELVNPDSLGPISMSIDKGFITGKRSAREKVVPVKSAYNYVIGVSNVGLDDLEKPEIDIILDEKATIVEVKVKSDTLSQDKIEYHKDEKRPNFLRIIPQYINKKDNITISVLSINDPSSKCNVMVGGKGITHLRRSSSVEKDYYDNRRSATLNNIQLVLTIIALIGAIVMVWLMSSYIL